MNQYKLGDKVSFTLADRIPREGIVYIINKDNTFESSKMLSYDVMVEDCLYKHIPYYLLDNN